MAMRLGAAETGAGTAEASAGGGVGADSAPSPFPSWTIVGWGEVALGGLSLKESPPWGDAAGRIGTLAAFLLLKTTSPWSLRHRRGPPTPFSLCQGGLEQVMRPQPVGLWRWVEVNWVFEVFGGYVGVVKMGLVGFRWWLVLVRVRIIGGLGQQRGR